MQKSTEKIVQIVQRQYFSEEIDCLTDGRQVKGHSKLSNLSPVLIEGTIHVGGRIRHAPIPFDAIHPMILPRDHPVSTFIVRHYHEYLGHAGCYEKLVVLWLSRDLEDHMKCKTTAIKFLKLKLTDVFSRTHNMVPGSL